LFVLFDKAENFDRFLRSILVKHEIHAIMIYYFNFAFEELVIVKQETLLRRW